MPNLGNPDVGAYALWATGGVANATGNETFQASLSTGGAPGQVLFGPGLVNVDGSEVHIVVRGHGEASDDPVILDEQLSYFNGGCVDDPGDLGLPDIPGDACEDAQFAIHLP